MRRNSPECQGGSIEFKSPLFADGMILQRDAPTRVWGTGAKPNVEVKVSILELAIESTAISTADGSWNVTLMNVPATASAILTASDGLSSSKLNDVAFGDVVLCGNCGS
jgi:hypothetical protein